MRRTKGWRKPESAIVVARPGPYGNPFPIDDIWMTWTAVGLGYQGDKTGRRTAAVALYRAWITNQPVELGPLAVADGEQWPAGGYIEFSDGSSTSMRDHVTGLARGFAGLFPSPTIPERPDLSALRGKDLACWCPPGPCHADVLLELANA